MGFIRDMHRLLLYKGYTFPEIRHEDAAVLNPSDVRVHCPWSRTRLTLPRIFDLRRRWRKKSELLNQPSCRSLSEEAAPKICRRRIG